MDSQTKLSPNDKILEKAELLQSLQNGVVEVTFDKLNGEERVMTCTLQADLLPETKRGEPLSETEKKNIKSENIVVWDVKAQAWRSFRYDRVKAINTSDEV